MNIDSSRLVTWTGKVDEANLAKTTDMILRLAAKAPKKEIFLWVCCSGGNAGLGFSFYDMMRAVRPRPKLVTIGAGNLSSMGAVIWLVGGRRFLTPNTQVFLHENRRNLPEGGYSEPELQAAAANLALDTRNYVRILVERSGGKLTEQKVRHLMKSDTTLEPEQLVRHGLAHGIAS
jgi:ATP-dependent Clp protease protease subunit